MDNLVTSLGVGGIISAGVIIALRMVWNKMWEQLSARDKKCGLCAQQHAEEIRELNAELRRVLEEVANG